MDERRNRMGAFWDRPTPRPSQVPPARTPGIWESVFGIPKGRPAAAPVRPKAPERPSFVKPSVDPTQYFDLQRLFEYIKEVKKQPGWKVPGKPSFLPLVTVARSTRDPGLLVREVARFLRIPESQVSGYRPEQAWQGVVEPMIKELSRALDMLKPMDLPGSFIFDRNADDGSFALVYYEK